MYILQERYIILRQLFKLNFIILFLFASLPNMAVQSHAGEPAIDEIINNLKSSFSRVDDYTVMLKVKTDIKDFYVPEMKIKVYFKQPDKIHLESSGFAMLPREGIFFNPNDLDRDNFYMSLIEEDENQEGIVKLELLPRKENIKVRKLILWVNTEKWIFSKIDSTTWQGQSVVVDFEYEEFPGRIWMPIKANITMNMAGFRGFENFHDHGRRGSGNTTDNKKGTVTVDFYDYIINNGIPDTIFNKTDMSKY